MSTQSAVTHAGYDGPYGPAFLAFAIVGPDGPVAFPLCKACAHDLGIIDELTDGPARAASIVCTIPNRGESCASCQAVLIPDDATVPGGNGRGNSWDFANTANKSEQWHVWIP